MEHTFTPSSTYTGLLDEGLNSYIVCVRCNRLRVFRSSVDEVDQRANAIRDALAIHALIPVRFIP